MDTRTVVVMAALGAGGFVVACAAVALFFAHSGPRRAGLVASILPLALLLPALAVSQASFALVGAFAAMAASGAGGSAIVTHVCEQAWTTVRGGAAMLSVVSVVAFVLGLVPSPVRPRAVACSFRRGAVLMFLALGALVSTAAVGLQLRSALRVASAVVAPATDDAQKAVIERVLDSEGLGGMTGIAAIARISDHIARRATLGSVGALAVATVLLGLTVTGALLAAPVRAGGGFVAAASSLWVVVALLAAMVAMGLGDPLRLG